MLKDDKMMSLLTFVIVMVAVGTLVQRMDVFQKYFGDGAAEEFTLVRDEAIVRANALTAIDVLANDTGLSEDAFQKLIIVEQPACGRVFARNGVTEYLPAERCVGQQQFTYAIAGVSGAKTGEVAVTVRLGELTQNVVAADAQLDTPAPRPQAPDVTEQTATSAQAPSAPAEQGTAALGAAVQAPSVPQPSAPAIGALTETAPAAAAAGESGSDAGIAREGSDIAPRLVVTPDPLSGGLASASASAMPLPRDPVAPSLVPPGAQTAAGQTAAGQTAAGQTASGSDGQSGAFQQPLPVQPGNGAATVGNPGVGQAASTPGTAALRTAPAALPGASGSERQTPAEALAALRSGAPTELAPVNTTPPAGLGTGIGAGQQPAQQQPAQQPAAQPAAVPCDTQPSLTLDVRPAAITYAIIESPCHKGTVAELTYSGLRLAIAIDSSGTGSIAAPGFEKASDAVLILAGGSRIDFNIPFSDTEKIDRVALASQTAIALELHAFEFGAALGSAGHITAQKPRHHSEVRRGGGGYMLSYAPIDGVGQAVTVYTFWHRRRGATGVVKLDLGIGATRPGAASCGEGAASGQPDFIVLRAHAGRLKRPELGVLAPMDCASLASSGDGFVADAIGDIIVRPR